MPPELAPLPELAHNLCWTWNPDAVALFRSIDPDRWQACRHNAIALLRGLGKRRIATLASDREFTRRLGRVAGRMRSTLRRRTWHQGTRQRRRRGSIAYFSMEFAIHESLPIFAGGLGVLAGDHLKSASDLGLPLVGVGIFWRHGYSRQMIDARGKQGDGHRRLVAENLPMTEAVDRSGRRLRIRVLIAAETVTARAWRVDVGRVPLFLLDTDLPANSPSQRNLTKRLYSGNADMRIQQEILLGIGGWMLLRKLGLPVKVCHLNEGHAVFCALARIADGVREDDLEFADAARRVSATTVFTTHTPIADGNETFQPKLVERYLASYCKRLGIDFAELLAMGRVDPADAEEDFGLTPLALRLADRRNGVSELHGQVSRGMWRALWPRRTLERVPIGSITNGIHLRTWLHPKMAALLDEYLPPDWEDRQDQPSVWARARKIPAARLWDLRLELKRDLFEFIHGRLSTSGRCPGRSSGTAQGRGCLDPDVLTIGFARRFASYKRATLIFDDIRRAERLFNNKRRPIQIIFAGKAHPADTTGKALVAEIVKHARSPRFHGRVVFLEDYDMEVARHMVAGVDVWLNTPQRPREASGTSGMKPTLHGGLNLSILDGWWPEACVDGRNGWAVGRGEDYDGRPAADKRDARDLYRNLECNVVPLYYRRGRDHRPTAWIRMMKESIATIPGAFNSHRMVKAYYKHYYLPALEAARP